MREYNGLQTASMGWIVAATVAFGLVTGGCAHDKTTDRAPPGAGPTLSERGQPLPQTPAPRARQRDLTAPDLDGQLRDDAPLRYIVKPGDTLWDIADYYLRDPWYWPQLWYDNPDIANPHRIYPGDVLILTRDGDGPPRLTRAHNERLSPRVRELPIDAAIPTIPIEAIRAFIKSPRLVREKQLEAAPYIVSFLDEHLVGGEGNTAYVRGADASGPHNYSVVRRAGVYTDPETGETLGHKAVPVAEISIDAFGDVDTGVITHSYREALTGDRLLPITDQQLSHDFHPHAPLLPVEGRIISVQDGVYSIGQHQIVTLSAGRSDGLERGHVLDVFEAGRVVRDPVAGGQVRLPENKSGLLLVFKTAARVSFALVMHATRALHVGDIVRTPTP